MRLSVQLYSLTAFGSLEDQLGLVQLAGIHHVETTTANYADVDGFRRLLDRFELTAPSGHFGIEAFRERLPDTVATARTLGLERLFLWGFPQTLRPADAGGWRRAGAELGQIAARLADEGLLFGFHNHDWELGSFEGRLGLDHLFEGAADTPLRWQPDLAWLARGGADASALLLRHASLVNSAHVKDLAESGSRDREGGWADLGAGILPWPGWAKILTALEVDLLVLEHDEPADASRFLTSSADAARRLFSKVLE